MQPTYTKLDDSTFEITEASTTQIAVADLVTEIANLKGRIAGVTAQLQSASDAGVADATTALASLS